MKKKTSGIEFHSITNSISRLNIFCQCQRIISCFVLKIAFLIYNVLNFVLSELIDFGSGMPMVVGNVNDGADRFK